MSLYMSYPGTYPLCLCPYDGQFTLTSLDESGGTLTLVLEGKLKLRFEGLKAVQRRDGELVFGPFDLLRFEWESFDCDGRRCEKLYRDGEVRIVGPFIVR